MSQFVTFPFNYIGMRTFFFAIKKESFFLKMFSPIDAEEDGEAADGARLVAAGRRRRRRLSDVQRGARQSAVQLQRQARRLLRRRRGPVSGTEFQFPPDLIARCKGY